MNELVSRIVGKPWPKGVSGNPSGLPGRPAGSRQTFSAGFLDDLAKTWRNKGRQTMEWTAENQPSTFFAVCARLRGWNKSEEHINDPSYRNWAEEIRALMSVTAFFLQSFFPCG